MNFVLFYTGADLRHTIHSYIEQIRFAYPEAMIWILVKRSEVSKVSFDDSSGAISVRVVELESLQHCGTGSVMDNFLLRYGLSDAIHIEYDNSVDRDISELLPIFRKPRYSFPCGSQALGANDGSAVGLLHVA